MPNHSVAQRYADALFAVALAHGTLEGVAQDLAAIVQILSDHPDLGMLWESPIVSTEDKKQVVRQLFEGKIDGMTLNTLLLMFDNKRGSGVLALQHAFRIRYDEHRKRAKVRVVSALPLDSREAEELREQLERTTARAIEMEEAVDPELIGGLVVTLGDTVIDNSLRGRLEAMARTLV